MAKSSRKNKKRAIIAGVSVAAVLAVGGGMVVAAEAIRASYSPPVSDKVQAAYEAGLKQATGPQEVKITELQEVLPRLKAGGPFTLAVIGDSTGFSSTGWVRPTVEAITAQTGKAAIVRDWDVDTGAYAAPITVGDGEPTLTVWNGSASGRNADYAAQNIATLLPEKADLVIVNHGHNSPAVYNATEHLKRLLNAIRTGTNGKDAALVVTAQNPRTDGEAAKIDAEVVTATKTTAATYKGATVLDVYGGFQDGGQPLPSLLAADGLHPSPAGYKVWSAAALKLLGF